MKATMSASEAILRTVADSPLAAPKDRAECQLALLVGDYAPSATLVDILAQASKPPTSPPVDLLEVVRAMGRQPTPLATKHFGAANARRTTEVGVRPDSSVAPFCGSA